MRDKCLEVEYEPTSEIVGYANNAKIHTAEQIEQIKRSVAEFGFNDPIAVWTNSEGESEIIEGHGRLLAAKELGIEAVPVIHLDALTDEQRRAYTHIHNQLTMNTGWDYGKLNLDLSDLDFDFKKFGFAEEFSFNAIDNLLDEDFVSLKDRADAEFYNITFSFPAETKELVTSYVKDRGKEKIVDSIVEEAQKWE